MLLKQISIFLENIPGAYHRILNMLEGENINIRGFCAADTGDYGVLRLVVSEPALACEIFEKHQVPVKIVEVVGVELADEIGELTRLMHVLGENNININYTYSIIGTTVAICADDINRTACALQENGFRLVSADNL